MNNCKKGILCCLILLCMYTLGNGTTNNSNSLEFVEKGSILTLESGDTIVTIGTGVSTASNKIDGLKWANRGLGYGVQIVEFPFSIKYIGIGVDFAGNNFSVVQDGLIRSEANTYNVGLLSRINLNPNSHARFYIPFGIGVSWGRLDLEVYNPFTNESIRQKFKSTDMYYHFGLGFEYQLSQDNLIGIEYQFNNTKFSADEFEDSYNAKYKTLMFKVGCKF